MNEGRTQDEWEHRETPSRLVPAAYTPVPRAAHRIRAVASSSFSSPPASAVTPRTLQPESRHLPHSQSSVAVVTRRVSEMAKQQQQQQEQERAPASRPAAASSSENRESGVEVVYMSEGLGWAGDGDAVDETHLFRTPHAQLVRNPKPVVPTADESSGAPVAVPAPTPNPQVTPGTPSRSDADASAALLKDMPRFLFARVSAMGHPVAPRVKLPADMSLRRIVDFLQPPHCRSSTTFNERAWAHAELAEEQAERELSTCASVVRRGVASGASLPPAPAPLLGVEAVGSLLWGATRLDLARTPSDYGMPCFNDVIGPCGAGGEVQLRFRHAIEDEEERMRQHIGLLQERAKFVLLDECVNPHIFVAVELLDGEPLEVQDAFYFARSGCGGDGAAAAGNARPARGAAPPSFRTRAGPAGPAATAPPATVSWQRGVFVMAGRTYRVLDVPLFAPVSWLVDPDGAGLLQLGRATDASPPPRSIYVVQERVLHAALYNETLQQPAAHDEGSMRLPPTSLQEFTLIEDTRNATFAQVIWRLRRLFGESGVRFSSGETLGAVLARRRRLASYLDPSAPLVSVGDDDERIDDGVAIEVRLASHSALHVPSRDIALFLALSTHPPPEFMDANDDDAFCDASSSSAPPLATSPHPRGEPSHFSRSHPMNVVPLSVFAVQRTEPMPADTQDGGDQAGSMAAPEVCALYGAFVRSGRTLEDFFVAIGVGGALHEALKRCSADRRMAIGGRSCGGRGWHGAAVTLSDFAHILAVIAAKRYPAEARTPRLQVSMCCAALQKRLYLLS